MPLGLRLKVRLTESDGCMTKSQRLNTHHLPQRVKGLSDLRGEAPFFRLWECFFEFSHTFGLICLRFKEIKSAITLMTLLVLVCINCCFFFSLFIISQLHCKMLQTIFCLLLLQMLSHSRT